jgi:hypothetical protein
MKTIDLTGQRFGNIEVLGEPESTGKGLSWKILCHACNTESRILAGIIKTKNNKSCGCIKKNYKGSNRSNWKGCGGFSSSFICQMRANAKQREIDFNLTVEYLWNLFVKQDYKCAYSGEVLKYDFKRHGKKSIDSTLSLDRIDSKKSYQEGNVQWVHKDVNFMKQTLSEERFLELCEKITKENRENK